MPRAATFAFLTSHLLANALSILFIVLAGRQMPAAQFALGTMLVGIIGLAGYLAGAVQNGVTLAVARMPRAVSPLHLLGRTARLAVPATAVATLVLTPLFGPLGIPAPATLMSGLTIVAMILGSACLGMVAGRGFLAAQGAIVLAGAAARLLGGAWVMDAAATPFDMVACYLAGHLAVVAACLAFPSLTGWRGFAGAAPAEALRIAGRGCMLFVLVFAPFSLDLVLVRMLAPAISGDYALLSAIAKLLFFAVAPGIGAMYARLMDGRDARMQRDVIRKTAAAVGVICLAAMVAAALAPDGSARHLFPGAPTEWQPLAWMVAGTAFFCATAVAAHAFAAIRPESPLTPFGLAALLGAGVFALHHDGISALAQSMALTHALQFTCVLAAVLASGRGRGREGAGP